MQQRQTRRFVDAAALGLDDAVLDLVAHAEPMASANDVGSRHKLDLAGELFAVDGHWPPFVEPNAHGLGIDDHVFAVVSHAHDGLNNVHARAQLFEQLGLVRGAPDVGVGAVGLFFAVSVGQLALNEKLAHLGAATELANERFVEPRLIHAQVGVHQQAIAVEPLDVVALIGAAVAPDIYVVFLHRAHEQRARDSATQWGGVEVGLAGGADVEGATLQRDQALVHQLGAAVDDASQFGAVLLGAVGDARQIAFVLLAKVGGVCVGKGTLFAHPGHGR